MKVRSEKEAFIEANKLMHYDYEYDVCRSKNAGYPIYFTTKEGVNEWISHLGNRLEVNLENGETVNIWIDDTNEKEIKIKINVDNARKVLECISGSLNEYKRYERMSDDEIIDTIINKVKCWGIEKA